MPRLRLELTSPPSMGSSGPPLALAVYAGVVLLAVLATSAQGRSALETSPWLSFSDEARPGVFGHLLSSTLGLGLAFTTVRLTRVLVRRWASARALHVALRSDVRHASSRSILVFGVASALGEELLFRGALVPLLGIMASSLAFGLLHQVRGRGRWIWAGWAAVMGMLFALLFMTTGSLLGPLLAHAIVNVQNLRFLRDTEVDAEAPRYLGGLLGHRAGRSYVEGTIARPSSMVRTISHVR